MAPSAWGESTSKGTAFVNRLTTGTMTSEITIASAPQLMGEAMSGVPKNPMTMLPVVSPTPTMKLAHTAARETRPE